MKDCQFLVEPSSDNPTGYCDHREIWVYEDDMRQCENCNNFKEIGPNDALCVYTRWLIIKKECKDCKFNTAKKENE